jgi:secreted trypsin-like serine protease
MQCRANEPMQPCSPSPDFVARRSFPLLAFLFTLLAICAAIVVAPLTVAAQDAAPVAPEPFTPDIIGGQQAVQGAWPWAISLWSNSYGAQICGASLIHPEYALTAAHCVTEGNGSVTPASDLLLSIGDYRLYDYDSNGVQTDGGQFIAVSQVIRYPYYNRFTIDNDLALLKLARPTDKIYPVELISPSALALEAVGRSSTVIGWGRTANSTPGSGSNVLMQVALPIVATSTCRSYFSAINYVTDNMICAGYSSGNQNACHGDSGGPLMTYNSATGRWTQLGIVSWGKGGCPYPHLYGVYTRVARYYNWIVSQVPGMIAAPEFDTTGDGAAEVVWRNTSTGANAVWAMNGASVIGYGTPWSAPASWRIAGLGDFTGEGRADIVWRDTASGQNRIWAMNGATVQAVGVPPAVADGNWKIVAIADFNADRRADLFWRNTGTGANKIWYMNGGSVIAAYDFPSVATVWSVKGADDMTGDNRAEIVWQHGSTGRIEVWYVNGSRLVNVGVVLSSSSLSWSLVGVADITGDSKADIVWRHVTTGANQAAAMNGSTVTAWANLPTVADTNWRIANLADYTKDRRADLVWRNVGNGQNAIWAMNGGSVVAAGSFQTVGDANWRLVGQGRYNGSNVFSAFEEADDGRAAATVAGDDALSIAVDQVNEPLVFSQELAAGYELLGAPQPDAADRAPQTALPAMWGDASPAEMGVAPDLLPPAQQVFRTYLPQVDR